MMGTKEAKLFNVIEGAPRDTKNVEDVFQNIGELSKEKLLSELGIKDPDAHFAVNEESTRKLKKSLDCDGNNLLARCAISGNLKNLKVLLKCSVIDIAGKNKWGKTAADVALEQDQYDCLLALLKNDSPFPKELSELPDLENLKRETRGYDALIEFIKYRKELHEFIHRGDLESVKKITEGEKSRFLLSPENASAMHTALSSRNFEIYAYLQWIGAVFRQNEMRINLTKEEEYELNDCMEEYFNERHDVHIFKLMDCTKFVQKYNDGFYDKVGRLYRRLDKFGSLVLLMKILTNEDVDIVFEFGKETIERMRYCRVPGIIGLADGISLRAYVAVKQFELNEIEEKEAAGVLAHELCHLVMQVIFKNDSKPYRIPTENEEDKREMLGKILDDIEKSEKHDLLMQIFDYDEQYWHSELIARVYELIVLGEEMTLRRELPTLYDFYRSIVGYCQDYLKDKNIFFKHVNLCHSIQKIVGIIPKLQLNYGIIRIDIKELNLEEWKEINNQHSSKLILKTSVPELTCMSLHVYLRKSFAYHFSKQCMFFSVDNFKEYKEKILAAFQSKACKYLVLVKGREPKKELMDELIEGPIPKGKTVIIIEAVPAEEENTGIFYDWKELPEQIREFLLGKSIDFQGKHVKFGDLISMEIASEIIHHTELTGLVEKNVELGKKYYFEDLPKYFVQRRFEEVITNNENNPNFSFEELLEKTCGTKDVIISDTFGSGKSTFLTYLMKAMKEKNPKLWLVRLKCQDYVQAPEELSGVSQLLKTLKSSGSLEDSCLAKLLTIKDRVKIFFDGHQKLTEQNQDKFLNMVLKLKQESQSQLWFFTVPQYQDFLNSKINAATFRISKLNKKQQIDLLNNYIGYKRSHESDDRNGSSMERITSEEILEYFSPEFDRIAKETNFLILLADAIMEHGGLFKNKLDLLSKVVHKKISHILDKQKVVDDAIRKPILEVYYKEHVKIVEQIIKHDSSGVYPNNSVHSVREYIHHIGLISPVEFQFLHSIIRDYFCVEWVSKSIDRDFPRIGRGDDDFRVFRSLLAKKLQSSVIDT